MLFECEISPNAQNARFVLFFSFLFPFLPLFGWALALIDGCDVCRSSCDDRDKLLPFPKRQFVRPSALVAMMMVRLIRLRNHQSLRRCRRTQCRRHPHPLRWPPLTSSQTRTPEHRCHRLYNKQVQKKQKTDQNCRDVTGGRIHKLTSQCPISNGHVHSSLFTGTKHMH